MSQEGLIHTYSTQLQLAGHGGPSLQLQQVRSAGCLSPLVGSEESLQHHTLTHPFQTCSRVPHANFRTLSCTQLLSSY